MGCLAGKASPGGRSIIRLAAMRSAPDSRPSLPALFGSFLRFGLLAWGGPVAQIGMIRRELVDGQGWLTPAHFNRLLAIYQILPGPEAHELCVHLGMMQRGRIGGLLAGLGFMLPGLLLILGISWLYAQIDLSRPPFAALLLGIQVAVVALIVKAVHGIGSHILADRWLWAIALLAGLAALAGASFWITLPAAAVIYPLLLAGRPVAAAAIAAIAALLVVAVDGGLGFAGGVAGAPAAPLLAGSVGAFALFLAGLKAGLLTFGGAYTAIPFVRGDAVGRGWVSDGLFLDGLALSGMIPAPLITFATFIGYQAGGLGGALAITAGIFLPAFAFTLLFFDRLERIVEDQRLHHLLAGVAAAVVGLIAATTIELAGSVARTVPSVPFAALIFAMILALLYRWRSSLAVLAAIPLSAAAGLLLFG